MDGRLLHYIVIVLASILVWYLSFLTSIEERSNVRDDTTTKWQDRLPSSIWCTYGPSKERLCKFKNICFDPAFQEFQFFLKEESVISGMENSDAWMKIALSTVLGHNAFYMKISLLKPGNKNLKDYVFISSPTFFIHRFKSDNIMHVLHDDLIPLHFTYESLSHAGYSFAQHASLALVDFYKTPSTDEWYKNYSQKRVVFLSKLNSTVCFADAYSGLYRSTIWFNYGFGRPQGPFLNDHFNVRGIRSFIDHNLLLWNKNLAKQEKTHPISVTVAVIVRNQTRRIVNMNVLVDAIVRAHNDSLPDRKLNIIMLDLAVHNTTFVLSQISNAEVLIGMHGAGMILSLFLPAWASVVELFPYAVNPNHVSFLKALTLQSDEYPILYESWQNTEREKSFPSAQNNPLLGQISHLPNQTQKEIMTITEVPAVYCCHDPAYLYYMYHDTLISLEIYHTIHRAFIRTVQSHEVVVRKEQIFPSSLSAFSCEIVEDILTFQWGEISNQQELKSLWFQITVKNGNTIMVKNETDCHKRMLQLNLGTVQSEVHGWIQPHNGNVGGHTMHSQCVFNK